MSIVALITAIAVCLIAVAFLSLSPMIWLLLVVACGAILVIAAKSKGKSGTVRWGLAILACAFVVTLVVGVQIYKFYEMEVAGPVREGNAAQKSIDTLLASQDPERFSKAMAVLRSLQNFSRRQTMTFDVYHRFNEVNGIEPLAESELEAGISAARAANAWPEFVPAVVLRRMQPADLDQVLQTFPTRYNCIGLDERLVYRVIERCIGPWSGRCAQELPRDQLMAYTDQTPRSRAIQKLIKSVWSTLDRKNQ